MKLSELLERDMPHSRTCSAAWRLKEPLGSCTCGTATAIQRAREYEAALEDAKEICICAAIQMPDGEVIRGHRHDACYDVVRKRPLADREAIIHAVQGFVTSRSRFVDRKEAMRLEKEAGHGSAMYGELRGEGLFSEDLYLAQWERAALEGGRK